MSLETRISRLEKTVSGPDLMTQIQQLEQQVDALLTKYNAKHLNFDQLKPLVTPPSAPQLSQEAKVQIIESRASEILMQTSNVAQTLKVPTIEPIDIDIHQQLSECIHEFDETTQKSIQLSRIYLESLTNPQ